MAQSLVVSTPIHTTSPLPLGTGRFITGTIYQEIQRSPSVPPGSSTGRWTYLDEIDECDILLVRDASGTNYAAKLLRCPEHNLDGALEVDILLHFRHPHLLPAYEAIVDEMQDVLVVMPLAQCTMVTGVAWPVAMGMWRQILTGVVYLAEHHLVHADLKPQNIAQWHTSSGPVLQLLDFGSALHLDPVEQQRTAISRTTMLYAAPELLSRCQPVSYSPQSESWSLGLIFLELLRGRPLYRTGDLAVLQRAARQLCDDLAGNIRQLLAGDQQSCCFVAAHGCRAMYPPPPPPEYWPAIIELLRQCLCFNRQDRCTPAVLYRRWFGPVPLYQRLRVSQAQPLAEKPEELRIMLQFLRGLLWTQDVETYSLAVDLYLRYVPHGKEIRGTAAVACSLLACQLTGQGRELVDFYENLRRAGPAERRAQIDTMFGHGGRRLSRTYWRVVATLPNLYGPHLYTICTNLAGVVALLSLWAEDKHLVHYHSLGWAAWPELIATRAIQWPTLTNSKQVTTKEAYSHLPKSLVQ
jgi:serine/threonine protein kinase